MTREEAQEIAARLSVMPEDQRPAMIALWIELSYTLGKSQGAAEALLDVVRRRLSDRP